MRKKNLWLTGVIIALLTACSVDDKSLSIPKNVSPSSTNVLLDIRGREFQRTSTEVVASVRNFEQQLGIIGIQTRSNVANELKVKPLVVQSTLTRAYLPTQLQAADTLLYLCELQDGKGFCVVSGDKRANDVLAYIPEGKMDAEEVMSVPGLSLFWELLPNYLESQISERQALLDSLQKNTAETATRGRINYGNSNRGDIPENKWETTEHAEAFLSTVWSQGDPFNRAAPLIDGKRAFVGCVAIAVGQLMAFYKYPLNIENRTIEWEHIINRNNNWKEDVSFILRKIGDRLSNDWGLNETGAYHSDVPKVLMSFGYKIPYPSTSEFSQVIQSLKENKPIIASGALKQKINEWRFLVWKKRHVKYEDGHEWIIDGYVNQRYIYAYSRERNSYRAYYRTLAHCNWGWGGSYNGYFDASVFDYAQRREANIPSNHSMTRASEHSAFQYGLQYITHVTP